MRDDRLEAAWRAARTARPEGMDRVELGGHVEDLARVRAWLDAAEVRAARRSRELADQGRSEPAEGLLGRAGRQSGKDARAAADRERVCDQMPGFEMALDNGTISAGHVDAVANATRNLDDAVRSDFAGHVDELVDQASRVGVDAFGRACREMARSLAARHRADADVAELEQQRAMSTVRRWVDKSTGMHHTRIELDPVRSSRLWSAVDRELRRLRRRDDTGGLPFDQLQVDALVAAFGGKGVDEVDDAPGAPAGRVVDRVPEITVLVHWERLVDDASTVGICETEDGVPLPAATVRRLCCDAEVLPAVLDGEGRVVDHGRSRRTVNREQRRRLRAMHRTCVHPDCQVGFSHCRIHHVVWWRNCGRTDIDNLVPLCDRHHHLVHEGGWHLTMSADRVATWARPDGVLHHRGPTIDRAAPHPELRVVARERSAGSGSDRSPARGSRTGSPSPGAPVSCP